ncbi:TPA: di-trans,poly-cis-decaprenylcistransferase [Candidatus Bathyarchaeota archaeon]|nr:di-trans,poly-cis-decaprenylcistransferase [Candidatus Bathyarchaeota archaeon]
MLRRLLSILGIYRIYSKWLWYQIKDGKKPEHIGVILDGNRRWARKRNLDVWIGHDYGAKKVHEFFQWCIDLGIKSVTIYVFSTENFQRDCQEVKALMEIFKREIEETLDKGDLLDRHKARVRFIGRTHLLPESLQRLIEKVEERTAGHDRHYLNIAIAYGGRAELTDAVKAIAERISKGELSPSDIDERLIEEYLYTSYLPQQDPDLIIRTSGEERLSGFLLWQSAYSELYFTDVFWPEFRKIDFWRAIRVYQQRERRFGH